jgi:phosphoglycerol transferase MdoB-like AlkP superfamily enzyme
LVLSFLGWFLGFGFAKTYMDKTMPFVVWSDTRNIQFNGRMGSVLYYSFRRASTHAKLKALRGREAPSERFQGSIRDKRNLHILVLESFLDPRLVKGIRIQGTVISPSFAKILKESGSDEFDRVQTPIYGGSTPQTEFEILTGLPALSLAESVEFNAMEGHAISSLCAKLKTEGYRCIATIATPPQFFNSILAYKSLGFDELHFLDGKSYLKEVPGDPWIFDGDLLAQNLVYIESKFLSRKQPILNYVLGSFGHLPFARNLKKRPDLCTLGEGSPKSPELHRILNQFPYRTEALATFIGTLRSKDPQALLYLTSDHLPPIFGKGLSYRLEDKTNASLFLDRGKRVPLPLLRSYALPYYFWGRLVGLPPCIPSRTVLEADYLRALSEGMGLQKSLR